MKNFKKLLTLLIFLIVFKNSFGGVKEGFLIDKYFLSKSINSFVYSTRSLLNRFDNYLLKDHNEYFLVRLNNLAINNFFNVMLSIFGHESGHAYRLKEGGYWDLKYNFYFKPSLSLSSFYLTPILFLLNFNAAVGSTKYVDEHIKGNYSNSFDLLINMGGFQSSFKLSKEILLKNFYLQKLDNKDYSLYILGYGDLYANSFITFFELTGGRGDVDKYIENINKLYKSDKIKIDNLLYPSLISFTNIMLYYYIYSQINYLFYNNIHTPIPSITLGQIKYLPIIRTGLTLFGLSYYLDNYSLYEKKVFNIDLNLGFSPYHSYPYGGIGFESEKLFKYKIYKLDLKCNLWTQPLVNLEEGKFEDKNYLGMLLMLKNRIKVHSKMFLTINLGYKTEEFIEGEDFKKGLKWQLGCGIFE